MGVVAVVYSLEILAISTFIVVILSSYSTAIRQIVFISTVIVLSTLIRGTITWSNQLVLIGILLALIIILGVLSYLRHKI